jgi:hypothetical protein
MDDRKRFWGVTWYELKMRLRSAGYWIVVLLVNAFALFVASPLNYSSPDDRWLFQSSWWIAGEAFASATTLMNGLGVFLIADRILRDRTLQTDELLRAKGVFPKAYAMGKWAASLFGLCLAVCPLFVGAPLIQWYVGHTPIQPAPFLLAFAIIYVPSMLLISTLALMAATLAGDTRFFYVPYLVVWYLDSVQFWVPRPAIRQIVNFSGATAFLRLFLTRVGSLAARGYPIVSSSDVVLNIGLLILVSGALLYILLRRETRAWMNAELSRQKPA